MTKSTAMHKAKRQILVFVSEQNDPLDELRRGIGAAFPAVTVERALSAEEAVARIRDVDILMTFSPSVTPPLIEAAPNLQWIQLLGSGLDEVLAVTSARPDLLLTTGRGAQAEPVSEAILAFMFALSRNLPRLCRNQAERRWERWPAMLLKGSTVMMVGVGAIAECLAPKCQALGMRTVGLSSRPRDVRGFDHMHPLGSLADRAGEADYLVLLTPLTDQTRNLVNRSVLAKMKPGAFIINAGRGGVLDETALCDALRSGQIAGAALDVFAQEPLAKSSPLWTCPNLLVSPHLGGLNTSYARELLPILTHNLECFIAGETGRMKNPVSREKRAAH